MDLMTPERMEDYHRILDKNLTQALEAQHGQFELFDLSKMVFFYIYLRVGGYQFISDF